LAVFVSVPFFYLNIFSQQPLGLSKRHKQTGVTGTETNTANDRQLDAMRAWAFNKQNGGSVARSSERCKE